MELRLPADEVEKPEHDGNNNLAIADSDFAGGDPVWRCARVGFDR